MQHVGRDIADIDHVVDGEEVARLERAAGFEIDVKRVQKVGSAISSTVALLMMMAWALLAQSKLPAAQEAEDCGPSSADRFIRNRLSRRKIGADCRRHLAGLGT